MIRLACKIPRKVTLACSGGLDSMSALEFLVRSKRDVTVAYYNHGTEHGEEAHDFLEKFCNLNSLNFVTDKCQSSIPAGESKEAFWREKRYDFFKKCAGPIVTAHHLDDAVEWWIFSSLTGNPRLMPTSRENPNVIRPFLLSRKEDLHRQNKSYPCVQDPSNLETKFTRNYIRHVLGPMCLQVNPGLHKTVKKMYSRS